ncbi:hypothetical protein EOA30_07635 [Mesorhizobium sp. M8A.F.Ca.ET.059.01.1.1]|nr:hypothetical protein EOA30_07635 [Mesorhizobium sp. M8A.F.Ca.ET.059.01.1.1]
MKQLRPFVVEIKQKRGLVKRPESIWAGIDLAGIAKDVVTADTTGAVAATMLQSLHPSKDVSLPVFTTASVVPDDQHVITPKTSLLERLATEDTPVPDVSKAPPGDRRTRRRKRWQKDIPLPRGERWKRRLPWVLRRRESPR